jgi:hypothetical protein
MSIEEDVLAKIQRVVTRANLIAALVDMGCRQELARLAADEALVHCGDGRAFETLLLAAIGCCTIARAA